MHCQIKAGHSLLAIHVLAWADTHSAATRLCHMYMLNFVKAYWLSCLQLLLLPDNLCCVSRLEAREEHHRFEHGEHHHAADQRPVLPHRNGSSGHHHGEGSRQEGHHEGHAHGEGLPEEHHRGPPGLRLLLVHAIEAEVPDEPRGAVGIRSMAARFSKGLDSMI